jgi:hypothetical protein
MASLPFSLQFQRAFGSPSSYNTFVSIVESSPLLSSLFAQFTGQINLGVASGGTFTKGNVITVDPNVIQQLLSYNQTPANPQLGYKFIADMVAHELGHAVLTPTADSANALLTAANPDAAKAIGVQQEGSAILAEYITAIQLGLPYVFSDLNDSDSKLTSRLLKKAVF